MKPNFTVEEAMERASVIVDCTPVGNKNKEGAYPALESSTKGFIAQGSEFGFGKMYARGINDSALNPADDKYIQVVSCNTHNLSVLVNSIAFNNGEKLEGLESAKFVCIRRSNDISQDGSFVPGPQVDNHKEKVFGTHHARDAHEIFKTLGKELKLFSSAMKINTQYMHTIWFHLKLDQPTTKEEVLKRLHANDKVALTHKKSANSVFSFGRDQGHYGRILNQTVIAESALSVVGDGTEVVGWCFTPQDGNSLLSSIAATTFFLDADSYEKRIQCLNPWFFSEV